MKRAVRGPVALAFAAGVLAGCGKDGTGGNPPGEKPVETPKAAITSSTLTAGGEGVLLGTALDRLPATLTVDGVAVTPTSRTATEVRFTMPGGRPCEVDGRTIQVQAGDVAHTGELVVPGAIQLKPGESRVLNQADLSKTCLQLPSGKNSYVLTALNLAMTRPWDLPDTLLTLRTWTGPALDPNAPPAQMHAPAASLADAAHIEAHQRRPPSALAAAAGPFYYSDNPVLLDPRLATAQTGDTLTWYDYGNPNTGCSGARDRMTKIPIEVVATSTSGKVVFAVYQSSRRLDQWRSPQQREWQRRIADIAEKWAVAGVREAMDPNFQPLKGAGGRWWHIAVPGLDYYTVLGNANYPQQACPNVPEVPVTLGPDNPLTAASQLAQVAGVLIHEYGHHAETVYEVRRWQTVGSPSTLTWPIFETWAQMVSEAAARVASGQPTAARTTTFTAENNLPWPTHHLYALGERPQLSIFGGGSGTISGGNYFQAVRMLLYLRERWGDAAIGSTRERFYARVQGLPVQDMGSIAGLVGLTATQALDQWSLADATDDLVDPAVVASSGLPQIQSWVPASTLPRPGLWVSRSRNGSSKLLVGRGNYAALYLFGGMDVVNMGGVDTPITSGVSMTFENVTSAPILVRVTRIK
jgi:predicted small lipoprotein YifL